MSKTDNKPLGTCPNCGADVVSDDEARPGSLADRMTRFFAELTERLDRVESKVDSMAVEPTPEPEPEPDPAAPEEPDDESDDDLF
jgi:hypothetical protein